MMRRLVRRSTCSAGIGQMFSSAPPCQSFFERCGRLYGGCGSAPMSLIEPFGSFARMPFAAMSPVMPAPMIRKSVFTCIRAPRQPARR